MQPVPEYPTNVQSTNPYNGQDRGLFLLHDPAPRYARIHAARWTLNGPASALGRLEYQVMAYAQAPVSAQDYLNGTLLTAPDGTQWFDCLTRGMVTKPILVEYWGKDSLRKCYLNAEEPAKLTDEELQRVLTQAQSFVTVMGQWAKLQSVELKAVYGVSLGQPLARTSLSLTVVYGEGAGTTVTLTNFTEDPADAVRAALTYIRSQQGA